ncbi:hypothetical protein M446_3783 [Methylobacterium sp. 4-46]|uniref:hypothetical protein n=1 Tax=unclassified Methylobacterium TaxID=2615210 RepID=UPI000165C980|nr:MULTISPECIES: hypothetical protein [Methylobacterium]ACA18161.1 hypothetical protein M446_3783 [Methylobacterium sp. 4-46]WFT77459.1 hypothetical protein QA634_19180 [Methylobacterium nodulans]
MHREQPTPRPRRDELRDDALDHVAGGAGSQQAPVGARPTGAGAGRATFTPFTITRLNDKATP